MIKKPILLELKLKRRIDSENSELNRRKQRDS
jgi:hypothetical protein